MIAVIADDFTGAAEIGGIGLRRGLKTVIETGLIPSEEADLLIIATDSRSDSAEEAIKKTEKITRQLMSLSPDLIYKKLDSVLRGNVADELLTQMKVSGKKRAVVVAGNPHLGRTIREGIYYINGTPLAETFFVNDPEFPVNTSRVREIIGLHHPDVFSLSPDQPTPENGLIFGDVLDKNDLEKWAGKIDENTMPAGGAEFFNTLIDGFFPGRKEKLPQKCVLENHILFVFGSAYPKDKERIQLLKKQGFVFMALPESLYASKKENKDLYVSWADDISRELNNPGKVVVHINEMSGYNNVLSKGIRECMGRIVRKVFDNSQVDDLLIEGGATTSVILSYLGINKLYPFRELESGVIQMRTDKYPGLCITTKPGSYLWPDCLMMEEDKRSKKIQPLTNQS